MKVSFSLKVEEVSGPVNVKNLDAGACIEVPKDEMGPAMDPAFLVSALDKLVNSTVSGKNGVTVAGDIHAQARAGFGPDGVNIVLSLNGGAVVVVLSPLEASALLSELSAGIDAARDLDAGIRREEEEEAEAQALADKAEADGDKTVLTTPEAFFANTAGVFEVTEDPGPVSEDKGRSRRRRHTS